MAYPISNDVLQLFLSQYRQIVRITMAGQNETFELTENDIIQNGFSVSRYSVSGSALELGSAISSEVDIVLNNKDGRFNATSFEGAELYVEVGIKKWDARRWEKAVVHYVPMGYFTVDNSPRKSQTISLAALDRMMQFAKTAVREKLVFPTTVGTLLRSICGECGITLATDISTLPNINQNIPECPDDEDLTYRTLLQWIAQMTGTCAYIDWEGKLRLEWYKTSNPTRLTPSTRYTPADLAESDITITGVELITDDDKTYLCGEETYTLVIEGNKLIQSNHEEILRNIYLSVGNFTYRTFSCNTKPFPHLFPLDMIEWEDAEGKVINTVLTNYSFSLNCSTALESKGDTETNVSYASSDPLTAQEKTVISKLKTEVSRDITARQQAVLDLNETIANALGLYETRMELNDKSIVCYYHDKPTLAKSTVIYTRNAGGYAWTIGENCWNDGNPTWQYGYTKDGNAVYNALSAYKIQTDLLDAGCVTAEKIKVGAIGGFDIDENHIGHGKTAYNDSKDGVFLSPTGIGLGAGKFYVTAAGHLHAEDGEFMGNIKGGTININDNFMVDAAGNVTLNGSITWGTGASPTQVVYARTSLTKPSDNTLWASFPTSSSYAWHTVYSSSDYYASFTYDGGKTWGEPILVRGINGTNGTNGTDGKDGVNGADGSDASVTDENVFNALTSNGTMYGCFTALNNKLYINAAYIRAGTVSSNITFTGKLVADDADISGNIVASTGAIGNWEIEDGVIHSTQGIYGTYSYTTTGTDLRTVSGYAFTALTSSGIAYYIKAENSWDSSTNKIISNSIGGSNSSSGGSTIQPL